MVKEKKPPKPKAARRAVDVIEGVTEAAVTDVEAADGEAADVETAAAPVEGAAAAAAVAGAEPAEAEPDLEAELAMELGSDSEEAGADSEPEADPAGVAVTNEEQDPEV